MKEEIQKRVSEPEELERLYHSQPGKFKTEFLEILPELPPTELLEFWRIRLTYSKQVQNTVNVMERWLIAICALIACVLAKWPVIADVDPGFFYTRNIAFIFLPGLSLYFGWREKLSRKKMYILAGVFLMASVFINTLPEKSNSDTLALTFLHLPIFLWSLWGIAFIGEHVHVLEKRIEFLKFNGDWVILNVLLCMAGSLMTAITLGLFYLIKIKIEKFYMEYIVIWELAILPFVGAYLVRNNPLLVGKVTPVIARIFMPLVLITLTIYLGAIIWTGQDLYHDRDFLILFNVMLLAVMAIILFSVAEATGRPNSKVWIALLFSLSIVTIVVNGMALSAILYRLAEHGITPNRIAVLGSNILILSNLFFVAFSLFKSIKNGDDVSGVGKSIARFMPIYAIWTGIVAFSFPFIFQFK